MVQTTWRVLFVVLWFVLFFVIGWTVGGGLHGKSDSPEGPANHHEESRC